MKDMLSGKMPVMRYEAEMGTYQISSGVTEIIRSYTLDEQLERLWVDATIVDDYEKTEFHKQIYFDLNIRVIDQRDSLFIVKGVIVDQRMIVGIVTQKKPWLFGDVYSFDNYEWHTDLTYPGGQAPINYYSIEAGMRFRASSPDGWINLY